jgi:hypothetical protein
VSAISQNQPVIIEIKEVKPPILRKAKQLRETGRKSVQWSISNVLKVSLQTTIYSLAQRGWSQRRIAKESGINRETVGRYLRLPKSAISITGSEESEDPKPAISITGDLVAKEESKPAISIAGTGAGRRSRCESFAELIAAKVEVV